MHIIWVLESNSTSWEYSAAVALMGRYAVRAFQDTEAIKLAWNSSLHAQPKPSLIYINNSSKKFVADPFFNSISQHTSILREDLTNQELICNRVQTFFEETLFEFIESPKTINVDNQLQIFGDIELNLKRMECKIEGSDDTLRLSPKEAFLLSYLIECGERGVSRKNLSEAVWGSLKVSSRTLDSHVSRLRSKLASISTVKIEAIYGGGYTLR